MKDNRQNYALWGFEEKGYRLGHPANVPAMISIGLHDVAMRNIFPVIRE